jgi:rhodanese-related sulfurtransferase
VRTRAEVKYIGMANMVDANIPLRLLRDDYAWSEKSATYRTRVNPGFVAAVERLLEHRGLDRNSPIILMCQSGSRVPAAARLLHQAGFGEVYTQYQGFEGFKAKQGPNKGQRVVNGWKNANLPWSYELDAGKMYFNFAP